MAGRSVVECFAGEVSLRVSLQQVLMLLSAAWSLEAVV